MKFLPSLFALALIVPVAAFAKEDDKPPQQTKTTKSCFQERQWDPEIKKWVKFSKPVNGVWDASIRKCVRPDKNLVLGRGHAVSSGARACLQRSIR